MGENTDNEYDILHAVAYNDAFAEELVKAVKSMDWKKVVHEYNKLHADCEKPGLLVIDEVTTEDLATAILQISR